MNNDKYFIGIDIGATNTKLGIVDKNNKIIKEDTFSTKDNSSEKILSKLISHINSIKPEFSLGGIGIGAAGPTNFKKGKIYYFVNRSDWNNIFIAERFKNETKLDTFVDNDVNVMALAEHRLGNGKKYSNLMCITLGTGVGGGIILNKKIYRGKDYVAGEIGHISINMYGPECKCGNRGCLESYVGSENIVKRTISKIKNDKSSIIKKLANNKESKITPKIIYEAYKQGDNTAMEIWKETGEFIGIALTSVINLLNLEAVIIGGGIANAGEFLFDSIYDIISQKAMKIHKKKFELLPAKLGEKAGIIGAAMLAKEQSNLQRK